MPTVKVNSDYQVELPREVRERVEVFPGQELKVHLHGDHIVFVPVRSSEEERARIFATAS